MTKLVWASSSSVYGKRSPIPFRVVPWPPADRAVSAWDAASPPGNMYAATKKVDEALVDVFCRTNRGQLRSLPVGLRFFTVYGPWGRPDMAVYAFADAMTRRQQLPLYHVRCVLSRTLLLLLRPQERLRSIVMSMSVCLSVCQRGYLRNHTRHLYHFLCMLPMSVARSSCGMLTIGRIACLWEGGDGSAPRGRSVIYDCLVLRCSHYRGVDCV